METSTSKLIGVGVAILAGYIIYKNHKKDGFWGGFGAAVVASTALGLILKK